MSIKKPNIYDKHSWINKEGKVKTSNVPPKRKDIQEREGLSYQYIDRTEIDCDWANELNKPKTKEMGNNRTFEYLGGGDAVTRESFTKGNYYLLIDKVMSPIYPYTFKDDVGDTHIVKPKYFKEKMKNKLSDKGLENLLSIPKEEIEAKIERRTIGYLFNNEKAYDTFVRAFKLLTGRFCPLPYEKSGFYINKGCCYDIQNQDCNIHLQFAKKYNLLDELFTPVYKKETKLQSGKWYKTNVLGTLWFINSIDDKGYGSGYGFIFGVWEESNRIYFDKKRFNFKEASKEYVESMLIKEAEERGLKQGVIANSMDGKETFRIKGDLVFSKHTNTLYCKLSDRYAPILENGIWIELKKESNYKTELTKALDNVDKVRKALEKLDSAISKIKSND